MSDKADLLADVECRNMRGDANENLVISSGEVVSNLEISSQPHAHRMCNKAPESCSIGKCRCYDHRGNTCKA